MTRELWTGEAVDQLLRGVGVRPAAVSYRVAKSEQWQLNSNVRVIVELEHISRELFPPAPVEDGRTREVHVAGHMLADDTRKQWTQWLADHGIDPKDVPQSTPITVDDAEQTITILTRARDEDGKLRINSAANEVVNVETTFRIGRPIAPFPGHTGRRELDEAVEP